MLYNNFYYSLVFYLYVGIGLITFVILFFITAPYGRHARKGWGPRIDKHLGWIIMEVISPFIFVLFFLLGDWKTGFMPFFFLALYLFHYIYRTFIFSALLQGTNKMPIVVILFGMIFNTANGYLQSKYLYSLSGGSSHYPIEWLATPQCIVGIILFLSGFIIHVHSDTITRRLRKQDNESYQIPYGGMFRYISAPNYLGEILQWGGWALLTFSLPGAAFFFWTAANLVPRAIANHNWYKNRYGSSYPHDRKAIIPYIV